LVFNSLVLTNTGNYSVTITNNYGSTNSAMVNMTVLPLPADPYQAMIIGQFPAAYYPLHETNGPLCVDMIDPNNNNGTYVTYDTNMPVLFSQAGPSAALGTAVTLNPIATNGISINNLNTMGIVGQLSLEAWINAASSGPEQYIVAHGPAIDANPNKQADILEIDQYSEYYMERFVQHSSPPDFGAYYGIPGGDSGTWVHLVGVADGTNWIVYRNGIQVASFMDTNTPTGAVSANGGWSIGARSANGPLGVMAPSFGGSIDNVAIYAYGLSPAQVLQHYQVGTNGVPTPPPGNPALSIVRSGGNLSIYFTNGFLLQAVSVSGPWSDVLPTNQSSPYVTGPTNPARYFKVSSQP
jgi:hypothetical protein